MLSNKQIRVGNIIASGIEFKTTSCIGKVLSIGNDEQEFEQVYCEENDAFSWFFKDSYCGIPINENILHLLGFGGETVKYKLQDCEISYHDNKYYYVISKSSEKEIKFMHDIQNWYFMLNDGKELNFDTLLMLNYDEYE